jgi:hypothetical protein
MEGEQLQRTWMHAVAALEFRMVATARKTIKEHDK